MNYGTHPTEVSLVYMKSIYVVHRCTDTRLFSLRKTCETRPSALRISTLVFSL